MADPTPMMKQSFEVKEKYQDAILFFRLGDFYEMFYDDAKVASAVLNIALTKKNCGKEEPAPMCGVPFHAADAYIAKMVAAGYKVAICEQAEDPALAKGIVKREVVRVVTPGTILNDELLSQRVINYMCCVFKSGSGAGIAFCEASTGEMMTTSFTEDAENRIIDEIARFAPVEIIENIETHENKNIKSFIENGTSAMPILYNDAYFDSEYTSKVVREQFGENAERLDELMTSACGAILSYIAATQQTQPMHIKNIEVYTSAQYMSLDKSARRNLELTESMRDKGKRGSLFWVLDDTKTPMGSRTMKNWVLRPLLNCASINGRLAAVSELYDDMQKREEIRGLLCYISDIERVIGRIVMGTANAKDLGRLRDSLPYLPKIKEVLKGFGCSLLKEQYENLDALEDIYDLLSRAIVDEPPFTLRDGGIIREGFSEERDALADARDGGSKILSEVENEEREVTGIKNLKVKYNKVFGYYIEISNGNLDKVPDYYIRKQTVVNGERFITPKLKEIEGIVLGASEKIIALEYKLFSEIRDKVAREVARVQKTARAIGMLDALASLASVAQKNGYNCPVVDMSDIIDIKSGRHPVVEKMLKDTLFVPNDTYMDIGGSRMSIVTGPNMAGKSTYMRQTALIVIMAQIGSFVPAESCRVGVVDKVFTRVGASDDLSAGQSTFMVEMSEVAEILREATKKSLLILDEIGRGTSTYDGLSIAWAVLEHCALKIGAKTLFATHYHELTQLEEKIEGIKNLSIAVKKRDDDIIFLRKIIKGAADESYGIEVAKLAGVPAPVINRAKKILASIESENAEISVVSKGRPRKQEENTAQIGFGSMIANELADELKSIDPNILSPYEALSKLFELKKKAEEI